MEHHPTVDTPAWILQVWVAFALSLAAMGFGIVYLPVEPWIRAFMGIGVIFVVSSSFTLAKTIRDNQEARRLINRVKNAKAEKLIRDFEDEDA
ncbi:MAG: hypothetical protein JRH20_11945 [Deltaproteobacteria bacterium]|nr:hypothetical protein [Deltaproteobacteria bacterium]